MQIKIYWRALKCHECAMVTWSLLLCRWENVRMTCFWRSLKEWAALVFKYVSMEAGSCVCWRRMCIYLLAWMTVQPTTCSVKYEFGEQLIEWLQWLQWSRCGVGHAVSNVYLTSSVLKTGYRNTAMQVTLTMLWPLDSCLIAVLIKLFTSDSLWWLLKP